MSLLPPYFSVKVALAPLPVPYMRALREIEIETAVGQASIFRLHFDLSRNFMGDFDALAIDIFRPLITITIRVSFGLGVPRTLINGYIKDATLKVSNEPGASTLEVVGMDALGTIMAHKETPVPWPNVPDSEVARFIFEKYAMIPAAFPTPPTRTFLTTTTTQRGYDASLLQQLAQYNSFELYIQPEPVSGRDIGYFRPPLSDPVPQGVLSIDFGTQTNLLSFNVVNDMLQPTSVVTAAPDPMTGVPTTVPASVSIDPPMGREPNLNRFLPLPPPIERMRCTDAANPAELQIRALARATSSSRSIRASGEVDGLKYSRPLVVGALVLVRGAGREYSGYYYVNSVTHRISRDNYTQSFTAWRNAVGLTGAEVFIDPLSAAA
jgi:hypothetical protein